MVIWAYWIDGDIMDIKQRIEELTKEINYHNYKYYVEDSPQISDFEFDAMLLELEKL